MNITVAAVTTKLVSFQTEKAAERWIQKQKDKGSPKGASVEYQLWTHPVPLPETEKTIVANPVA